MSPWPLPPTVASCRVTPRLTPMGAPGWWVLGHAGVTRTVPKSGSPQIQAPAGGETEAERREGPWGWSEDCPPWVCPCGDIGARCQGCPQLRGRGHRLPGTEVTELQTPRGQGGARGGHEGTVHAWTARGPRRGPQRWGGGRGGQPGLAGPGSHGETGGHGWGGRGRHRGRGGGGGRAGAAGVGVSEAGWACLPAQRDAWACPGACPGVWLGGPGEGSGRVGGRDPGGWAWPGRERGAPEPAERSGAATAAATPEPPPPPPPPPPCSPPPAPFPPPGDNAPRPGGGSAWAGKLYWRPRRGW